MRLPVSLMTVTLALAVLICGDGPARAKDVARTHPGGVTGTNMKFDVPGGSMARVLGRFERASGLRIVYGAEVTDNAQSLGVKGRYGRELALQVLLACTGVDYEFVGEQTVVLRRLIEIEPVFFDDAGNRLVDANRHQALP